MFESIFEKSLDALLLVDIDSGEITNINPATRTMLGYTDEQLIGKHFGILFPREIEISSDELLARIHTNGPVFESQDFLRNDGTICPMDLTASIVSRNKKKAILITLRDVTERKQVENSLIAKTRELTRSNEELQKFAYAVSHDLQEPLRTIAGFIQIFAKNFEGKLDKKNTEHIERIVHGAERMKGMISDLLAYSKVKIDEGNFESVDCEEILEKVLGDLHGSIEQSGGVIHHEHRLPTVSGDASQVRQVFQNLLSNAIKFSAHTRQLKIHITVEEEESNWKFSVSDNGIGIEPRFADRIFEIFQRLHTQEEYSGTGIGLAICRRIINRHGGKIWVQSEPDEGTIFFFTLPKMSREDT